MKKSKARRTSNLPDSSPSAKASAMASPSDRITQARARVKVKYSTVVSKIQASAKQKGWRVGT